MEMTSAELDTHANRLARDGIVVVENYLSPVKCDDLRHGVEEEVESGRLKVAEGASNYQALAGAGEPVIDRRGGERDVGMFDIFNMQMAIPELADVKEDPRIEGIINGAADVEYRSENLNIYINRSVTNTRAYHADTYTGKYKAFVYLTDVPDENHGPFSYVRQSQAPGRLKRKVTALVNRLRGLPRTNAIFYKRSNILTCTAPRGTLIIANQAGLHRGMPQEQGKERMLISLSYGPDASDA